MEIKYQEELLRDCLVEVATFIDTMWHNTPEFAGQEKLEFDWKTYCALEQRAICHTYTARDLRDGLVGVAIYMVLPHMHYKHYIVADCDTLYVSHKHRGLGIARHLYEFLEPKLNELGAREILNRAKMFYNADHLFPSLGFKLLEAVYSKRIG